MKSSNLYWRTDSQIRAPEVRVIGEDGKQLGVMSVPSALEKAKEKGLTLVEIAAGAKPPVVKIVNFGKFRYQEEKKFRAQAKKAKPGDLKEVRFSPFIADNDYKVRLQKVKGFLADKDKVRLVVVFRGPQMGSKPFGYNLLKRILDELGETVSVDMQPKFLGKHLMMIVSPLTKRKNAETPRPPELRSGVAGGPARNASQSDAGGKN